MAPTYILVTSVALLCYWRDLLSVFFWIYYLIFCFVVSEAYTNDDSLNYGIIFDCGSSGTRVYIYYWPPHSGDSHQLLDIHQLKGTDGKPLSKKISPGKRVNCWLAGITVSYLLITCFTSPCVPEYLKHIYGHTLFEKVLFWPFYTAWMIWWYINFKIRYN